MLNNLKERTELKGREKIKEAFLEGKKVLIVRWTDCFIGAGEEPVSIKTPSTHRLQNRLGACRQFEEELCCD
jgi:hypothetical protein